MGEKRVYFTRKDLEIYQKKIEEKTQRLKDMYQRLSELYDVGGDSWHDNFSYEQQIREVEMLESQIKAARKALKNYKIIEPKKNPTRVGIGTKVTIKMNGEIKTWEIVGFGCSQPSEGKVAYNTPLGKLLIKKEIGEEFSSTLANREVAVSIVDIE